MQRPCAGVWQVQKVSEARGITEGGRGHPPLPPPSWKLKRSGLESMARGVQWQHSHLVANAKEACPKHPKARCSIPLASGFAALNEEFPHQNLGKYYIYHGNCNIRIQNCLGRVSATRQGLRKEIRQCACSFLKASFSKYSVNVFWCWTSFLVPGVIAVNKTEKTCPGGASER